MEALQKLAGLFIGKTGIFDHSASGKDQTARIYETAIVTDPDRTTAAGEPYTCLRAKAYMVRTEKNKDLIAEIEAGIKKETSVGCCVQSIRCSVCGKDIKTEGCTHQKGRVYGGKRCHYLLDQPTDAYEWSFVAVPAQRNAGVVKSFTPGAFAPADPETQALAAAYRAELLSDVLQTAARCVPTLESKVLRSLCADAPADVLKALRDAFRAQADQALPLLRQLQADPAAGENENNAYQI